MTHESNKDEPAHNNEVKRDDYYNFVNVDTSSMDAGLWAKWKLLEQCT